MPHSLKNFGKKLESLGYCYKTVAPEIFLVFDVVKDEEIKAIYKEIESASEESWKYDYMNGLLDLGKRKYGRTDINNLIEEGLIEVTTSWIDKNIKIKNQKVCYQIAKRVGEMVKLIHPSMYYGGIVSLQRQYSGVDLVEHIDSDTDPNIKFAAVLYLNDDYLDGEVFFSKLGIDIKPPAKSLLIFPSGKKYLHGVRAPGEGPYRYVLPSFIYERPQ